VARQTWEQFPFRLSPEGKRIKLKLKVNYHCPLPDPPKNTSVLARPSSVVDAGRALTLTCSSQANPAVDNFTWHRLPAEGVPRRGESPPPPPPHTHTHTHTPSRWHTACCCIGFFFVGAFEKFPKAIIHTQILSALLIPEIVCS